MVSEFIVVCRHENVTRHIKASSVAEAESIVSTIPKSERRGVFPLYNRDILTSKNNDEED